jgi:hypothetical protein
MMTKGLFDRGLLANNTKTQKSILAGSKMDTIRKNLLMKSTYEIGKYVTFLFDEKYNDDLDQKESVMWNERKIARNKLFGFVIFIKENREFVYSHPDARDKNVFFYVDPRTLKYQNSYEKAFVEVNLAIGKRWEKLTESEQDSYILSRTQKYGFVPNT